MAPEVSNNEIENLLISVNETGTTDYKSLLAAYKNLDQVLKERKIPRPIVILADGHGSRFNDGVMQYCDDKKMQQFILPPDTSGVTQKHDQL